MHPHYWFEIQEFREEITQFVVHFQREKLQGILDGMGAEGGPVNQLSRTR